MLKFKRTLDGYQATRKDGQVITIEKYHEGDQWVVRYEGDHSGDNTDFAKTKKELVAIENRIEESL